MAKFVIELTDTKRGVVVEGRCIQSEENENSSAFGMFQEIGNFLRTGNEKFQALEDDPSANFPEN